MKQELSTQEFNHSFKPLRKGLWRVCCIEDFLIDASLSKSCFSFIVWHDALQGAVGSFCTFQKGTTNTIIFSLLKNLRLLFSRMSSFCQLAAGFPLLMTMDCPHEENTNMGCLSGCCMFSFKRFS